MVGRKKGFVMTQEHKDKISKANKDRVFSEEHKRKISEASKRKKKPFTEEHKKNISLSKKGKCKGIAKWSKESRIKLSLAKTGDKTFEGFRTELRQRIRLSSKYLKWRADVFKRDNYHCQECGEKGRLEAHHLIAFAFLINKFKIRNIKEAENCKELWDIGNGITYCKKCHILLDENFGWKSSINKSNLHKEMKQLKSGGKIRSHRII